jgi:hypothetical protein
MYIEGDVPVVTTGNNGYNNGFGFGGGWEGLIGLIAVAALFGGGYGFGGGFGFGGNRGGYGGNYATQADLSAGFANSEIMSDLNDILLSNAQGFANVQQTLCQGFNGINTAILQSSNATERGFATLGYNLANCCCELKGAIADVKYANERQTCDIINAINAGNQRIVDIYTSDKIDTLNRKLATAEAQLSNQAQSAYIINQLKPCPTPAYVVPNPNCCYTTANTCGQVI